MAEINVLIYDDNADRRESLTALLSLSGNLHCVGSFPDCSHVAEEVASLLPDVVLMDIDMPNVDGIEGLKIIHHRFPGVKVLMQTVFEQNEKIFESLRHGAAGYILKTEPPARITEAIHQVFEGGAIMTPSVAVKVLQYFQQELPVKEPVQYDLSEREKEVLKLLADGNSYKMIASSLAITYYTVNAHLKKIYEKLQVHSASEAVSVALRNSLV
ncbi:MAG: response regulator transcription factor [Chitinophagales bacterium]|nr:response regulator transcription factor [Chitinophagales bacterium]